MAWVNQISFKNKQSGGVKMYYGNCCDGMTGLFVIGAWANAFFLMLILLWMTRDKGYKSPRPKPTKWRKKEVPEKWRFFRK